MKTQYTLHPDRRGMIWDLLLYIPTVIVLSTIGLDSYFEDNINLSYLLFFLAAFFAIAGTNRILKTRLMIIPTAPIAMEVSSDGPCVILLQKNGEKLSLVKSIQYFADYSGRSFGLSGLNSDGVKKQFVFHLGQFESKEVFETLQLSLKELYSPTPAV
jgi:hypothetical protein